MKCENKSKYKNLKHQIYANVKCEAKRLRWMVNYVELLLPLRCGCIEWNGMKQDWTVVCLNWKWKIEAAFNLISCALALCTNWFMILSIDDRAASPQNKISVYTS